MPAAADAEARLGDEHAARVLVLASEGVAFSEALREQLAERLDLRRRRKERVKHLKKRGMSAG